MIFKKISKAKRSNGSRLRQFILRSFNEVEGFDAHARRIKSAPHHERPLIVFIALCVFSLPVFARPRRASQKNNKSASPIENVITSTLDLLKTSTMPELLKTDTTHIRTVIFNNVITEKMITYTGHWAKPYPSTFSVSVNDQPFITLNARGKIAVQEKEFTIPPDNTLKIQYEWALDKLGKRWYHEKKEVTYKMPDKVSTLDIDFGFDKTTRVEIPQGTLLTCNELISKTNA